MRQAGRTTSLVDILDRVLDKGIVIDATVRVSLVGIDLIGVDAKITVASFRTYLQLCEDPRAYEMGLIGGEPPVSVLEGEVRAEARRALPEATEPIEAGPSLGGPAPGPETEELPRAAFHEEAPPDDELT